MLQLDGLSKQLIAVPVLWKLHSVSLDLHAILLSHGVSAAPSSDMYFEHTLCYHPRHNAVVHEPPVSPNAFSARRDPPQPSSSCE
jgi:hypothetical protein